MKLCLVPVPGGAGMAQIKILLGVLLSEVDVVRSLAQMHRAQHAGVAIGDIKPARIANLPVCKPLYHIQIWLLLYISLSRRACRETVLWWALWRSTMESTGLVGKSGWNSVEFCNYSDSGCFQLRNIHRNFIFLILKFVPANSEHVSASSESSPSIDSSNFMHRKMFLPFSFMARQNYIYSFWVDVNFGGMIILPAKITFTCFE